VGSEAYAAALLVYNYAKASGKGAGLDGVVDELGKRFARKSSQGAPPPIAWVGVVFLARRESCWGDRVIFWAGREKRSGGPCFEVKVWCSDSFKVRCSALNNDNAVKFLLRL